MALDKFRDPADPLWEQRVRGLEEGSQIEAGGIKEAALASEAVTGAKVAPAVLAGRVIATYFFAIPEKTATGLYLPSPGVAAPLKASEPAKGTINFEEKPTPSIALVPSTYAITGRTTKLTLEVTTKANAKAPGVALTFSISKGGVVLGATKKLEETFAEQIAAQEVKVPALAAKEAPTNRTTGAFPAESLWAPSVLVGATETAAESVVGVVMSLIVTYS